MTVVRIKMMNWDARNHVNVNDRPIKTRIVEFGYACITQAATPQVPA